MCAGPKDIFLPYYKIEFLNAKVEALLGHFAKVRKLTFGFPVFVCLPAPAGLIS